MGNSGIMSSAHVAVESTLPTALVSACAADEGEAQVMPTNKLSRAADKSAEDGGLPPGWRSTIDKKSGRMYYFNRETNEVTWTRPEKEDTTKSEAAATKVTTV